MLHSYRIQLVRGGEFILVLREPGIRFFIPFCIAVSVAGCSIIEIEGDDGVEIRHGFGVVNIEILPGGDGHIISSRGVGIIRVPGNLILGYHEMQLAEVTKDCVLIIWAEDEAAADVWLPYLDTQPGMCVLGPTSVHKKKNEKESKDEN